MAFINTFRDKFGNTYDGAYFRIVQVLINWDKKLAQVGLAAYKDKSARMQNNEPVEFHLYHFVDNPPDRSTNFSDIFSIDKFTEPDYNLVREVYVDLMQKPEHQGSRSDEADVGKEDEQELGGGEIVRG